MLLEVACVADIQEKGNALQLSSDLTEKNPVVPGLENGTTTDAISYTG
jgi:hypothetical protein